MKNDSVEVTKHGDVFVLTMLKGQNKFNPTFIKDLNEGYDFVQKSDGAAAVVTVSNDPKFWSNGLDLEYMGANPAKVPELVKAYQGLLARLLVFPIPTVAALNGHAVAAGGMMALAHDFRIMRHEENPSKIIFWLPEIQINIPFTPGMSRIISAKLVNTSVIRDAMMLGKKYGAKECLQAGIVDELVDGPKVLSRSIELAQSHAAKATDRRTYFAIKFELFKDICEVLKQAEIGDEHPLSAKKSKL